jgi:hypothetical protein
MKNFIFVLLFLWVLIILHSFIWYRCMCQLIVDFLCWICSKLSYNKLHLNLNKIFFEFCMVFLALQIFKLTNGSFFREADWKRLPSCRFEKWQIIWGIPFVAWQPIPLCIAVNTFRYWECNLITNITTMKIIFRKKWSTYVTALT